MTCVYHQPQTRVALVGCVAQKGARPAPARELYTSPLFRYRLAWAATVWGQLHQVLDVGETHFTLLAGKAYITYLAQWLKPTAAACETPLARMSIGQQLHWLKGEIERG